MTYYPKFFLNKGRILALWVMYTTKRKNSLKFKLLAFGRKQTPFIYQKCTYEKVKKMPKTDTLDALDDAMTTILTTNLDN